MRIEGLAFTYGQTPLFSDFAFSCDAPVLILRGRSGCGKTTLLKLMCGLLQPRQARVFEVPPESRMVLQEDALFPWLTVRQNVTVVTHQAQLSSTEPLVTPIAHLLDRHVFELSFGQRRTVELCRALMNLPSLLCLDEPLNFLDLAARRTMAELIHSAAGSGRQVVLTTHHEEDIALFDAPVFHFPEEGPIAVLTEERHCSYAPCR